MMTPARSLLILAFLAACGEEGGPSDDGGPPVMMQKPAASGDGQVGTVATTLPSAIQVLLLQEGTPVAGRVVSFTPGSGAGSVQQSVDTTDAAGIASTAWTLGTASGPWTVLVTSPGVVGAPLGFSATALPGAPTAMFRLSGEGQAQVAGTAFTQPLVVRVGDAFGNAVPGLVVEWTIAGAVGFLTAATSVTGADGRASVGVTAGGSAGGITITAALEGAPAVATQFGMAVVDEVAEVVVNNNFFSPAAISIPVGGAVRWVWNAGTHNVAQLDGPVTFTASPVREAGASHGPVLFSIAGTYHYECSLHEGMLGTITVVGPGPVPSGE